jgi:hypothetical protein
MHTVAVNENIGKLHVSPGELEHPRVLHMMQKLVEKVSLAFGLRMLRPGRLVLRSNGIRLFSEWHYP